MNKIFLSFLFLGMVSLSCHAGVADYHVVPLPQSITAGKGGAFTLTSSTPVVYAGNDEDIKRQTLFLSDYIEEVTGIRTLVQQQKAKAPAIVLAIDKRVKGREAYCITVSKNEVKIVGSTPAGVFYGIQTLRKSLPVETAVATSETLPAAVITDSPRFGYRGMMLDCSRHFFPVAFVKKYIDLIALHNMNVFHWHLSDDQGWRIEIKKYPRLTDVGAWRSGTVLGRNSDVDDSLRYGGFYTQDQAREIVEYARQRHITVIPEIDMPGHTFAVLAAYPEFGCTGGPYEVGHYWGIYHKVLCLGNEKIYDLINDVIDELCDIFPSKYIHIGGDETPTDTWAACPKDKTLAAKIGVPIDKLQAYFTNKVEKYVNSKGRSIIGWDEILGGPVSKSAAIMSWRGAEPGKKAVRMGHDVIMSPTTYCYFDYPQVVDRKDLLNEPVGPEWAILSVDSVYAFNPIDKGTTDSIASHILGIQGNVWTEYITCPTRAEYAVLPRMAALCEDGWTEDSKKNFADFKLRVTRLAKLYDKKGLTYGLQLWPERYHHQRDNW